MPEFTSMPAREQAEPAIEPFHITPFPDGKPAILFFREGADYLLRFPGMADFLVTAAGDAATCIAVPGVPESSCEHLFLNQVHPMMLSKRGELVFHASAAETPHGAIAFLGVAGRGKSTLAASFAVRGRRFLTDDGLWLRQRGPAYLVMPSHPSIRLWDDSRDALLAPGADAAPALHFTTKGRFLAGDSLSYCDAPRPLRAAYFLGEGAASSIEIGRVEAGAALIEWLRNAFLIDVEDRGLVAGQFERTVALANAVPAFHLDYPRRFDELDRLIETVTRHSASEGAMHEVD